MAPFLILMGYGEVGAGPMSSPAPQQVRRSPLAHQPQSSRIARRPASWSGFEYGIALGHGRSRSSGSDYWRCNLPQALSEKANQFPRQVGAF